MADFYQTVELTMTTKHAIHVQFAVLDDTAGFRRTFFFKAFSKASALC